MQWINHYYSMKNSRGKNINIWTSGNESFKGQDDIYIKDIVYL